MGGPSAPQQEFVPLEPDRSPADTLRYALTRLRAAACTYDEVELVMDTPTTRVPLEEFHREETAALLHLTFPRLQAGEKDIRYEVLPHLEVVELYHAPHEVVEVVQELFPGTLLHSAQGRMMERAVAQDMKLRPGCLCMHAARCGQGLFLFAVKGRQLLFASTYACTDDQDGLYFLLNAWKALDLQVMQDVCVLHGACRQLAGRVGQFIKNVESCE